MLMIYLSTLENEEDRAKFAEIYEKYKYICLSVAMKVTGGNQAMSEDAVHNTFISIIKHKNKYLTLPCGKLKSLIVIISKNKAIDLMRGEKHNVSANDEDSGVILKDDFDISEHIADIDAVTHLMDYIAALPELYKSVFELRYVHDLSNPEIAEILDITAKLVSMRIARAKVMLRNMLEKEDFKNDNS